MGVCSAEDLVSHTDHRIEMVHYGDHVTYENISLECTTCYEVLRDYDKCDFEQKKEYFEFKKHIEHYFSILDVEKYTGVYCETCQYVILHIDK